jgi:hypothetical protein
MSNIKSISSSKNGQIVFGFDNGVKLSFVWDWGTYSDNHLIVPKDVTESYYKVWNSTTVEIYSVGYNPNGIDEYLDKKYKCGTDPAAFVPVADIPKILKAAAKKTIKKS